MPTRFIAKFSGAAAETRGIGIDSDDNRVYVNPNGTRYPLNLQGSADLTATNSVTSAQSGGTFFLNSTTEFVTTLPAPAAGLRYRFYVKAAPSGADYTVVTHDASGLFVGHVLTSDVNSVTDPDFETSGGDTITFVASKAVQGDYADLFSDGTDWYVTAVCSLFDAITITGS